MCQISSGCALNALLRERERVKAQASAARITYTRGAGLVAGFSTPIMQMPRPRPISMSESKIDAREITQIHQAVFDKGIGYLKFNSGTSGAIPFGSKLM